jgi:twitching motility protein PilT
MDLDTMNKLLSLGVQNGASDIHFRPGDPPTYRVNGALRALKGDKLTSAHTRQVAWNLIQDPAQKDRLDTLQEMDCSYTVPGVSRFRVNLYRQRGSLSAVLRIIPAVIPTLDMLKLPPVLKKIAHEERGLVLVTGATGSGKTSTLAALIDEINNTENVHILTIEDPIEFLHKNNKASISQREIGLDTHDYAGALRAALRQDPDVIFVGEMRDIETIDIALKAAETGHLVLSTVHTTDAAKTVNRLVSVFPAEEQQIVRMRLADTLKATVSQRLLPTIDNKNRACAVEVMIGTKTVQEYVRDATKSTSLKDVIEKGRDNYGMQSFDQHLTQLYKGGVVALDVARAAASNPADFERALNFE